MEEEDEEYSALEAIHTRRSIRKYLDVPVEFEKIGEILNAGKMAPSAGNLQGWKFIIVIEPEQRLKVAEACLQQYWMGMAPVHIVVCSEPKKSERYYGKRGEELYTLIDAGACMENMLLAAHAQDLGACLVSAFEDTILRRTLKIPDDVRPVGVITVGYPAEEPVMPLKYELHSLTFFEKWGTKVKDEAAMKGEYSTHVAKALEVARKWAENVLEKIRQVK